MAESVDPVGEASTAVQARRSPFRLTPFGDAVRGWSGAVLGAAAYTFVLIVRGVEDNLLGLLAAVDTYYTAFLALTWIAMYRSSGEDTRQWALVQESGTRRRQFVEVIQGRRIFSGGVGLYTIVSFSLIGLMFALLLLPGQYGLRSELLQVTLCVAGVVTAWLLLHTAFALYYAHLYYRERTPGGLDFPGREEPDPVDFAYFAFTVGISFAASDVGITARRIRRVTLFHGVLSFFYNTAILALVINIVLTRAG